MWVAVNPVSDSQAFAAMGELAGIDLGTKLVHRIASRIGQDRCAERTSQVDTFRVKSLANLTGTDRYHIEAAWKKHVAGSARWVSSGIIRCWGSRRRGVDGVRLNAMMAFD